MAKHNPFRMFRKNQKAWLAGLTLFTMFSFIALGSMFQCLQVKNPGWRGDSLYATTKTLGNLDYAAYVNQQNEVHALTAFLQTSIAAMAQENLIASQGNLLFTYVNDESGDPKNQIPVLLDNLMVLSSQLGMMTGGQNASQNLVNRWLVIESGRKAGMAPTENNVRDYLARLFMGKMNSQHLTQALRQSGLKQEQLVGLLANQIVYDWMLRQADGGWRTDPGSALMETGHGTIAQVPGETVEAADRLYRSVKADVATFPVNQYFDQIATPSEEVLKAYYEKYKNVRYSEDSKEPGFYLPTKASFEVIRGTLTEERLNAVTDEEIAAYYEENKESFAKPTTRQEPEDAGISAGVEGAEEFTLPDELDVTEVTNAGGGTEEVSESIVEEAPTEESVIEETPAEESVEPVTEEAPAEPVTEEAPAEETPAEEASPEAGNQDETSAVKSESPFRLVSYQEENAESVTEENAEPTTDAAPETASEGPSEEAPVENAESEATEEVNAEYFSLDEVKESIRRQLATEKLTKDLEAIQTQMEDYSRKLANKRANVSTGNVDLTPLDLKSMAESAGFEYYATTAEDQDGNTVPALLDIREAAMVKLLPVQALYEVYGSSTMDFSPRMTPLTDDQMNLYWVTEVKGEHLPEYSEVSDLVLATWKKGEAISKAEDDAQKLADQVKGGAKLADLAASAGDSANYVFSKTESFTEFSAPRSFRNPSLTFCEVREEGVAEGESETQNKGIIAPGYHFYDAVYDQEVDGVAVVRNQPEDRVFVIQVTEKDSDDSVLEKTSGVENDYLTQEAVRTIRLLKNAQFQEDWIDQLKKNAGFEWVVVPGEIQSR